MMPCSFKTGAAINDVDRKCVCFGQNSLYDFSFTRMHMQPQQMQDAGC